MELDVHDKFVIGGAFSALAGVMLLITGIALMHVPGAIIFGGICFAAFGALLVVIGVKGEKEDGDVREETAELDSTSTAAAARDDGVTTADGARNDSAGTAAI